MAPSPCRIRPPRSGWAPVSASPPSSPGWRPWCAVVNNAPAPPCCNALPAPRPPPYHSRLAELCRRAGIDYRLHLESERGRLDLAALGKRQHTRCGSAAPSPWPTAWMPIWPPRCTGSTDMVVGNAGKWREVRAQLHTQSTPSSALGTISASVIVRIPPRTDAMATGPATPGYQRLSASSLSRSSEYACYSIWRQPDPAKPNIC